LKDLQKSQCMETTNSRDANKKKQKKLLFVCFSESKRYALKTRRHPKIWRESTLGVSVKEK